MSVSRVDSATISWLRFPLIVGVVFIHAYTSAVVVGGQVIGNETFMPLYHYSSELFSQVIARIAVPLFFLFSGFLFFSVGKFDIQEYGKKIRSRSRSLLIPYLFWNIFVILLNVAVHRLPVVSGLLSGSTAGTGTDFNDLVSAFWNYRETGYPVAYQFWFIRDLIVVIFLSPVIYLLLKYFRWGIPVIMGVLWFTGIWEMFPGFSSVSFFFFTTGAWFSLSGKELAASLFRYHKISYILYPLIALADLFTKGYFWNEWIHNAGIISGVVAVILLVSDGVRSARLKSMPWLSAASFFVFAFHEPLLALLRKSIFFTVRPSGDISLTILYFLIPLVTIAICLVVYAFIMRLFPRFMKVICGGR